MSEAKSPFIRRVKLRNYKSIRECDVTLGPLTFLVGPNGSGKSNFLDALRFVADALRVTPEEALRGRHGIEEVTYRRREAGEGLAIELWLTLTTGEEGYYGFEIGTNRDGGFEVRAEECRIGGREETQASFAVMNGVVQSATIVPPPAASTGRLYLTIASGFPELRGIYDALAGMAFYNINPVQMREDPLVRGADRLGAQGEGVGTVFRELMRRRPARKSRLEEYLRAILPCMHEIAVETVGEYFRRVNPVKAAAVDELHRVKPELAAEHSWLTEDKPQFLSFVLQLGDHLEHMTADCMSDGTLRALGILLALFQSADRPPESPIPLVGIEEPEAALHPAAAGVLFDALSEASAFTQVMVTTHSAELLNSKEVDPQSILVVEAPAGETVIGRPDEVSLSVIRDRLYTPGELLEMNQLHPDASPPQLVSPATHVTP